MDASRPTVPAPIVWAEVVARDLDATAAFYSHVFGWRFSGEPSRTDLKVYLDQGRTAGPICGARPRSPVDVAPPRHEIGPGGIPADRWTLRLSPPRPPAAVDPDGDQLLRPRAPGPRIGRFGMPQSLCFFELRTDDIDGASAWMTGRLDARLEPLGDGLLLHSSVEPALAVAAIVAEDDRERMGWTPCVQVPSIDAVIAFAEPAGARSISDIGVPPGAPGARAIELIDPAGARVIVIEHGPRHGRR